MPNKISVITVCFNEEKNIKRTIESVINQDAKDFEFIVIDGGSTDNTLSIIEAYRDRIDHFISEQDEGIYDAMNKGISLSSGDYLYFLNADDFFSSENVISSVSQFIDNHPDCEILSGHVSYYDIPEERAQHARTNFHFDSKLELYTQPIGQQCIFSKRSLYDDNALGKLSTSFTLCSDFEWLIKAINKGCSIHKIDLTFANVNYLGLSYQQNKLRKKEKRQIILKQSSLTELLKYLIQSFKKLTG